MFNLEEFIQAPNQEALLVITRDELLRVAGHHKIEVGSSPSKAELQRKLIGELHDRGLFGEVEKVRPEVLSSPDTGKQSPVQLTVSPSKAEIELKRLELREKEIEWERERTKLEADRQTIRDRERREHELRIKELEFEQALRVKELDIKAREAGFLLNQISLM